MNYYANKASMMLYNKALMLNVAARITILTIYRIPIIKLIDHYTICFVEIIFVLLYLPLFIWKNGNQSYIFNI